MQADDTTLTDDSDDAADYPVEPDTRLQIEAHATLTDVADARLDDYTAQIGDLKTAIQNVRARDVYYKDSGDTLAPGSTGFTHRMIQSLDDAGWHCYLTTATKRLPFEYTTYADPLCSVDGRMLANAVSPDHRVAVQLTFGNKDRIRKDISKLERLVDTRFGTDLGIIVTPTHALAGEMSTKTSHHDAVQSEYEIHRATVEANIDAFTDATPDEIGFDGAPLAAFGVEFTHPLDDAPDAGVADSRTTLTDF